MLEGLSEIPSRQPSLAAGHAPSISLTAQVALATRLVERALLCLIGILAVGSAWSASAASDAPTQLRIVWSFDHDGIARLCQEQGPAVIYFKCDIAREVTSILKRELSGEERLIAQFPGSPDERSLSCSEDGRTIAALDTQREKLFLMQGANTALYRIPRYWAFSNVGIYSLLAPDGRSITLPEAPTLVAGVDLLRDMRILPNDSHSIFFVESHVYVDREDGIHTYLFVGGEWKEQGQRFKRPGGFRCQRDHQMRRSRRGFADRCRLVSCDGSRRDVAQPTRLARSDRRQAVVSTV